MTRYYWTFASFKDAPKAIKLELTLFDANVNLTNFFVCGEHINAIFWVLGKYQVTCQMYRVKSDNVCIEEVIEQLKLRLQDEHGVLI